MPSQGPNYPSTAENRTLNGVGWLNANNILASDDARASCNFSPDWPTDWLVASGFGFAIPSGATIDGIVVEWERYGTSMGGQIADNAIRIVKGGSIGSSDRASGATWPGTGSEAYASYGSSSDLWGQTWTPGDINASDFGAALSARDRVGGFGNTAYVDTVRITVYYTEGGGGGGKAPVPLRRRRFFNSVRAA